MTLLFFLLLKGTEQSHIRDFTTQSTQMNISKCHDCTSSALHSLSYMDRVSAGSMLHAGSTLCLLSSVREQIDRTQKIQLIFMKKCFQSSTAPNHKKECPWHDGHCCAIRHIDASRRPEKLTILSLVLVTWAIQLLQKFPSPSPSILCFSFNIWLLESRTYTGNMWPWVQSPILCWMNLLKVKGITFQNNMEELFCLQQLKCQFYRCKKCLGKQIGGSKCGFMEATVDLVWKQCSDSSCCSPQHTHSYEPFSLLTLLSSGSLKLWLLKDEELRLISSGCTRLPTPSWFPCLSSSSGSLSFFRFALLMESSSEKRLTCGRSDGDLSGLWISVDKGEGR